MARATLIAESIGVGRTLAGVPLAVREIEHVAPANVSPAQRKVGIPERWTHACGVPEAQIDWP